MTSPTSSDGISPKSVGGGRQFPQAPSPSSSSTHVGSRGASSPAILGATKKPREFGSSGDIECDSRRISQREKQIGYGKNTEGYTNMLKLIQHDPRIVNGGVLPLEPPAANLKISKRSWDLNVRRWRRALHMFDYIYLEGQENEPTEPEGGAPMMEGGQLQQQLQQAVAVAGGDASSPPPLSSSRRTLADIVELQRQQWVNPQFVTVPKLNRVKHRVEDIMAARNNKTVPKRLPVEDSLISVLRSPDCYDPVQGLLPDTSSGLTGHTSPQNAGYKILIAPVTQPRSANSGGTDGSSDGPSARRGASPVTIHRAGGRSPSPVISTQSRLVDPSGPSGRRGGGSPTQAVPFAGFGDVSSPSPKSPTFKHSGGAYTAAIGGGTSPKHQVFGARSSSPPMSGGSSPMAIASTRSRSPSPLHFVPLGPKEGGPSQHQQHQRGGRGRGGRGSTGRGGGAARGGHRTGGRGRSTASTVEQTEKGSWRK